MKRIQQALCTLSTGVLRRLLVCSVGMAAAAVPVSRVTWSQYQTLYNQLRCQRWTTQGRRCFISTSSVWATGEDFIVDSIDDEDKYVCEISNIADSGHQVLVVQPGKTSLIKALTADRQLEPRDQLFATLDVTAHGGTLPNMMSVLFIDTVGFIADIPVMLTEAFAATLEDAVLADLVLLVCDMSHPDCCAQRETVLRALGDGNSLKLGRSLFQVGHHLSVSASTGQNLDVLQGRLQAQLLTVTKRLERTFRLPMSASQHLSWLYKNATVTEAHPDSDINYILVDVIITEAAYGKFKAMFVKH